MLDFDGDVESAFLCSFEISYSDVFGNHLKHELIENGKDVMVTNENREVLKLFPLLFEFKEIVLWHSVDGKTLGCREIHWSRHSMNACKMHLVVVAYLTWVKRVFFVYFPQKYVERYVDYILNESIEEQVTSSYEIFVKRQLLRNRNDNDAYMLIFSFNRSSKVLIWSPKTRLWGDYFDLRNWNFLFAVVRLDCLYVLSTLASNGCWTFTRQRL